jgi:hypothetical protein
VNTIARGNAAEAAVLQAFAGAGVSVLIPFGSGLSFARCRDAGRSRRLDYRGRADALAVYVAALSRVFVVPVDDCPVYTGFVRLDAPRNNQRQGVRFADDYAFERWLESYNSSRQVA